MKGKKWTEDEIKIAIDMYNQQMSLKEIAYELRRSYSSVNSMIYDKNSKLNKYFDTIQLPARCRKWTLGEIEYIGRQRRKGRPLKDISKRLNRSYDSVRAIAAKHNFKFEEGDVTKKRCIKCLEIKALKHFSKRTDTEKRFNTCKICRSQYSQKYYREKIKNRGN